MSVDLNKCKYGDKLICRNGAILIYDKKLDERYTYKHLVRYPNGTGGTRMSNGLVYIKNENSDGDIVAIFDIDIDWEEI